YNANASFRTNITSRLSTSIGATTSYAPFYQYLPFLSGTATQNSPVGSDYGFAVDTTWVRSTGATASIEEKLTRRTTLSGVVAWNQQFLVLDQTTVDTDSASMRVSHNLTRKFSIHIGYGVQEARYPNRPENAQPFRNAFLDFGFGYGDGLTLRFG